MTRRFFGLQGALLGGLLLGSCKQDSITTVGIGTPAGVSVELKSRTMSVADSVRTFAQVRDQVGNPLAVPVTLTAGCTAGIVSVGTASDAPLVRTAFIVRAVGYGTGCVIASASGFVDTMKVTTVAASLVVTGETGDTSATGATTLDSANSGYVVTYTYAYKDAAGNVMNGLPASTVPTLTSADTTIAKPTGLTAAGRAAGSVTLTLSGTAGVALTTTKSLTVLPLAFTGTTSSPVDPGALLTIRRNPAAPPFTASTTTSIGTVTSLTADSIKVRIADLATAALDSFSITGVGPNYIAYANGTYTVKAPAAFGGTFAPAPLTPTDTITVTQAVGDSAFSASMKVFRAQTVGGLAAVTPVAGSITATSFKLLTTDLDAGGTYTLQITRLGTNNVSRRGTYTLAVGTFGGTVSPSSGVPASKIVLHRAGGDPPFSAAMRVYFDGIRAWIDTSKGFSTDTVIVAVPPVLHTGAVAVRISRIGATRQAEDVSGFTSTTASPIDAYGYSNLTPDKPAPITANGNYYFTMAGVCPNGSPTNGGEKCDAYFKITNSTAVDATVTISVNWLTGGIDPDLLWCKGTALSNPPPNNVPACGTVAGGADIINCACAVNGEGPPEFITFTLPKNTVYVVWVNLFDGSGTPGGNLMRFQISGLP